MITRILEIIYTPFNLRIVLWDFLQGFSQNLPGSYPVASSRSVFNCLVAVLIDVDRFGFSGV